MDVNEPTDRHGKCSSIGTTNRSTHFCFFFSQFSHLETSRSERRNGQQRIGGRLSMLNNAAPPSSRVFTQMKSSLIVSFQMIFKIRTVALCFCYSFDTSECIRFLFGFIRKNKAEQNNFLFRLLLFVAKQNFTEYHSMPFDRIKLLDLIFQSDAERFFSGFFFLFRASDDHQSIHLRRFSVDQC